MTNTKCMHPKHSHEFQYPIAASIINLNIHGLKEKNIYISLNHKNSIIYIQGVCT